MDGPDVLQSLSLQSAFYLRFAVCSLPSVLPRPAVCSLRFTLADETQPQVSFPKAICLPEIYKRSRLFSEPFRRKYRKYQAIQVPINSTKTNRIFISCLFFLHFYFQNVRQAQGHVDSTRTFKLGSGQPISCSKAG